jgi:TPR repeat protein
MSSFTIKILKVISLSLVVSALLYLTACNKENPESTAQTETPTLPVVSAPKVTPTAPVQLSGQVVELQRRADEGDSDAQYDLAYMYENGIEVPKDLNKAIELYDKSANKGNDQAQENLKNIRGH